MDRYSIVPYEDEYGIEPVLEDEYGIEPVRFYFKREFNIFGFSINIEIIRWEIPSYLIFVVPPSSKHEKFWKW